MIAKTDPHRVDRLPLADPLKLQAIVIRVYTPEGIGTGGLLLGGRRESMQQISKGFGDT